MKSVPMPEPQVWERVQIEYTYLHLKVKLSSYFNPNKDKGLSWNSEKSVFFSSQRGDSPKTARMWYTLITHRILGLFIVIPRTIDFQSTSW